MFHGKFGSPVSTGGSYGQRCWSWRQLPSGPLDVQNIREIQTQKAARTPKKILLLQNIAVLMSLPTQLWPESCHIHTSTGTSPAGAHGLHSKLTMPSNKRMHLGHRGVCPLNCAQSQQEEQHRWTEVGHFSAITVRTRLVPWAGH